MTSHPFHVARGPLPSDERGLGGVARVRRLPNGRAVGHFVLKTPAGPLEVQADLSNVKAKAAANAILPENAQLAGWREGGLSDPSGGFGMTLPEQASPAATYARQMAQLRARNVPLAQLAGANLPVPWGHAERLYAKILERDPRARAAVADLLARARAGDANAALLWQGVCAAHARAKDGDFTRATPSEKAHAAQVHAGLLRRDPNARAEVERVTAAALAGSPQGLRMWKLLCIKQEESKATLAGGGVFLSPERVAMLLEITLKARHAPPPFRDTLPGEEVPPMGAPPPLPKPPIQSSILTRQAPSTFTLTSSKLGGPSAALAVARARIV